MLPQHIKSADDLVTSTEETQRGFLIQALRKTKEAAPYIEQARRLLSHLTEAKNVDDAARVVAIQKQLVAAAGFSDKAAKYFNRAEIEDALAKVMAQIKSNAGPEWREEITYRFLLTRGDSLGGAMRNIVGSSAAVIFTTALLAALEAKGIVAHVEQSEKRGKTQAIGWKHRHILFDVKSPIVKNNIDVILLDTTDYAGYAERLLNVKERHLVLGELKGGIDPAGADEHWKTARAALDRIRAAFSDSQPKLFFVGAAIENAMAREIYAQLQDGRLTHAANLLSAKQLPDLAEWLASI